MPDPIPVAVVGLNFGSHIARELAAGAGLPHVRLDALARTEASGGIEELRP